MTTQPAMTVEQLPFADQMPAMRAAMRDPRTDPMAGDVLNVYRADWRQTFGVQVIAVGNGLVVLNVKGIFADEKLTPGEWQHMMRDATIVHATEG